MLIWLSVSPERIGQLSRDQLTEALASNAVSIAAITPWEIATMVGKSKLALTMPTLEWLNNVIEHTGIGVADLSPATAVDAGQLPGVIDGDPADRMIVATARALGCALMTADRAILDYAAAGHVQAIDAQR